MTYFPNPESCQKKGSRLFILKKCTIVCTVYTCLICSSTLTVNSTLNTGSTKAVYRMYCIHLHILNVFIELCTFIYTCTVYINRMYMCICCTYRTANLYFICSVLSKNIFLPQNGTLRLKPWLRHFRRLAVRTGQREFCPAVWGRRAGPVSPGPGWLLNATFLTFTVVYFCQSVQQEHLHSFGNVYSCVLCTCT